MLLEHANCVFPIDNKALQSFVELESTQAKRKLEQSRGIRAPQGLTATGPRDDRRRGFDSMNQVSTYSITHLLTHSFTNLIPRAYRLQQEC